MSAQLRELDCKDRTELLGTAAGLRKSFDDFVEEHQISVPDPIRKANEFLSDEAHWKDSLRDIFDTLSALRAQAGAFLAGVTLNEEPPRVGAGGKGSVRSRQQRTT